MQYKYTSLANEEIVFRALSAEEADRVYQSLPNGNVYLEEYIFNLITDSRYDIDSLEAGIVPTIVFAALKLSGVLKTALDLPDGIEKLREIVNGNAYYLLYATIVKAQPSYDLSKVRKLSFNELMEEFAFSELILGQKTIDTAKARKSIEQVAQSKDNSGIKKKGIKAFTSEEIDILKQAIGAEEYGGMPIDGF